MDWVKRKKPRVSSMVYMCGQYHAV